ncbi:MAG: rhombotarget lipoprotein [Woeseiaceae bacterium]|nr:rhombotarget lipoprotein [Woeseiaceae bacterium]
MNKRLLTIALFLPLTAACSSFWMGPGYEQTRQGTSSSLVDFLYPDGEIPPSVSQNMPYLELPVRVGIAFVPAQGRETISAAEKQKLMEHTADAFRDRDYVQSIETIPDAYMRSARGVQGMKQVASLHGIDVMALVSYDQMSFSGERDSAIMYWTVVGALFVKGNRNEVQTMIDTAVFDVKTAKLLFRAPGVHKDQRNITLLESDQDLRRLREEGFTAATDNMIVNLDAELDVFRNEVDQGQVAQVAWRQGYSGGGSFGWPIIAMLLVTLVGRCRLSRAP